MELDINRARLWFLMHVPDVGNMMHFENGYFDTREFIEKSNGDITLKMLQGLAICRIIKFNEDQTRFRITDINDQK